MKYGINYQQLHKGADRPTDEGAVCEITIERDGEFAILPNVGDPVYINNSRHGGKIVGTVRTRFFRYLIHETEEWCLTNIVVEEDDLDWGALVKE